MTHQHIDIWFARNQQVMAAVPFEVAVEWVQEAHILPNDRIRTNDSDSWTEAKDHPLLQPYFITPATDPAQDTLEVDEDLDFLPRRRREDEDDDVDMIPLIDISLVLLIFFMMTATVATVSKVEVAKMKNAGKLDASAEILRIDVDWVNERPLFSLGTGSAVAPPDYRDLAQPLDVLSALEKELQATTKARKVRIAGANKVPFEIIDQILQGVENVGKSTNMLSQVTVQVSEKP